MSLQRSFVRVAAAATVSALALIGAAIMIVRQPVWRAAPDRVRFHADGDRLQRNVRELTAKPRCAGKPDELARAADYLADEFRKAGAIVTQQRFMARGGSYQNVIATYGRGPAPVVVVGAHYDSFCEPVALPGADDNASGTAGLLELARLLDRHVVDGRIDLVAYANEEPPFFGSESMGSAVHAASLGHRPPMIALEMIGYFTATQPSTGSLLDRLFPRRGDFVVVAGRWEDRSLVRDIQRGFASTSRVKACGFVAPASSGIEASDHSSYWQHGHRAVMITDTAYVRNPNYHTLRDTAETLDYQRMSAVVDGVLNVLLGFGATS